MNLKTLSLPQVVGLIAVVVILVFGMTYASIYLSGLAPSSGPQAAYKQPEPQIIMGELGDGTVVKTKPIPELESGPGHQNFWFHNRNDSPVKVWLIQKKCTCSTVKIAAMPPEWKSLHETELEARENDPALVWEVVDKEKPVMVPPQTVGGIQLHWNKTKPQPKETFAAALATEMNGQAGTEIRLEVEVHFVDPVRIALEGDLKKPLINNELEVGILGPNNVVGPVNLVFWSTTRPEFNLTLEDESKDPCVTWGQPVKMDAAACKELGERDGVSVLIAYKVPVTVRERAENGKQLDMGPFRRTAAVNSDAMAERTTLRVAGGVRGEVVIGGPEDRDQVSFGAVESSGQRSRTITLASGVPGLKLELDPDTKLPDYLKGKIEEDPEAGMLGKSWTLTVTLQTDKVHGPLPRDESLVVLRTNSNPPRRIRIPVTGNVFTR